MRKTCSQSSTVCGNAGILKCTTGKDGTGECTFPQIKEGYTLYLPSQTFVDSLEAQEIDSHTVKVTGELLVNETYCCSGAVNAVAVTPAPLE